MKDRNLGTITLLFLLLIGITLPLCAQNISLQNPSFEGAPSGKDVVPHGWYKISGTPDVQPGMFSVTQAPVDGQHFVGMHSGPGKVEGIAQVLKSPLKAGLRYTLSLNLAFVTVYSFYTCYGNLAIFGGSSPKDTAEMLWSSGPFTHQNWKAYTAVFTPHKDYKYISLWAYPTLPCNKSKVGVALLIDNLSKEIQQTVVTETRSTPSCNNSNTGTASIKITGGQAPYDYTWSPGNYKTASVANLAAGTYQVTAKAANGLVVQKQVTVAGSSLTADAKVATSACYSDNNSQINVTAAGGVPPYVYYLNSDSSHTPAFRQVAPGPYQLVVQDQQLCADTFALNVQPPPPLSAQVAVTPAICKNDSSGQFVPHVQGGTPPFTYRLDNGSWQPDSVFTNLAANTYHYEVLDNNQCSFSGTAAVPVDAGRLPVVNVAMVPASCSGANNGQLIPRVQQGGIPPFFYRLNGGPWQTDSVFANLPPGNYAYEVKDQSVCTVSGTVAVTSPYNNCTLIMPSAFSPNGDGSNDVFRPKVYDNISQYHIRIFNRWGMVIYDGNNWQTGWDGTYKGAAQDQQTYIYICTYTDGRNTPQELKGTVTLIR